MQKNPNSPSTSNSSGLIHVGLLSTPIGRQEAEKIGRHSNQPLRKPNDHSSIIKSKKSQIKAVDLGN